MRRIRHDFIGVDVDDVVEAMLRLIDRPAEKRLRHFADGCQAHNGVG